MKLNRIFILLSSKKRFYYIVLLILPVIVSVFAATTLYNIAKASFGSWGNSSLIHACENTRGGVTLVNPGDSCKANETEVTWLKDIDVDTGSGLSISRSSEGATLSFTGSTNNGWTAAGETWTYASADDPTYTFTVSGDETSKYAPGMRVKLTQTTTKYFLITGVSYSSPNTTVTLYGGTDYNLANATISSPYYSMMKAPVGFPLNPAKWTVEVSDTTQRIQAPPTQNTWYNLGSVSVDVPVGVWRVFYSVYLATLTHTATQHLGAFVTLSTSNNSESDADFTNAMVGSHASTDSNPAFIGSTVTKEKIVNLTSKTTYYLISKTDQQNMDTLYNNNNYSKLFIRAVSSYL